MEQYIFYIAAPVIGAIAGAIGWFWRKAYTAGSEDAIDDSIIQNLDHKIDEIDTKVSEIKDEMLEHIDDDKKNFDKINERLTEETSKASELHRGIFTQLTELNRTLGEVVGTLKVLLKEKKD